MIWNPVYVKLNFQAIRILGTKFVGFAELGPNIRKALILKLYIYWVPNVRILQELGPNIFIFNIHILGTKIVELGLNIYIYIYNIYF